MSSKIVRHGGAGVVTAEGVTAGPRAAKLARARAEQAAEFEAKKQAIAAENASVARIGDKFAAVASSVETTFKAKTVGLVSLSEYNAAMEEEADAAKNGPLIAAAAAAAAALIESSGALCSSEDPVLLLSLHSHQSFQTTSPRRFSSIIPLHHA